MTRNHEEVRAHPQAAATKHLIPAYGKHRVSSCYGQTLHSGSRATGSLPSMTIPSHCRVKDDFHDVSKPCIQVPPGATMWTREKSHPSARPAADTSIRVSRVGSKSLPQAFRLDSGVELGLDPAAVVAAGWRGALPALTAEALDNPRTIGSRHAAKRRAECRWE